MHAAARSGQHPAGAPADSLPARGGRDAAVRVLLVEDEPGIVDFVSRGLQAEGFAVESALDGLAGERRALTEGFDLVLLDLMLPGRGGLDVLASIRRARPSLPVVVLTARSEIEDRVAGLDAGAVDYLVKPFSMAELVSRVRAHLRFAAETADTTLSGSGLDVDLLTREVRRDGERVSLSTTEFELLVLMLRHHGQVLTREQMLSAVWGYEHDPATNVVDVYIGYLRRKLARVDGSTPIFTVRSVGYRLGSGEQA